MSRTFTPDDISFMRKALLEADIAFDEGEVPIGAVAVRDGEIIGKGHNQRRGLNDITAHAEMMCLRNLGPQLDKLDLSGITIYTTLEPCAMCAGGMVHYGCKRVVYGARDLKLGAAGSTFNLLKEAGIANTSGVLDSECREILYKFFEIENSQPSKTWEDIELE